MKKRYSFNFENNSDDTSSIYKTSCHCDSLKTFGVNGDLPNKKNNLNLSYSRLSTVEMLPKLHCENPYCQADFAGYNSELLTFYHSGRLYRNLLDMVF